MMNNFKRKWKQKGKESKRADSPRCNIVNIFEIVLNEQKVHNIPSKTFYFLDL